jgi:DNA mismatch repair ATPase MutL
MMSDGHIDITPSPRLLQVLGDIPLAPWQCVAEFVDNSLDELARGVDGFRDTELRVDNTVEPKPRGGRFLVIRDNGLGMGESELGVALRAGATSKAR